jgi:hypothetical protein
MTFVTAILLLRRRASARILLYVLKSVERVQDTRASPMFDLQSAEMNMFANPMFANSFHALPSVECS